MVPSVFIYIGDKVACKKRALYVTLDKSWLRESFTQFPNSAHTSIRLTMTEQYEFDIHLFASGSASGYHIENLPDQKQRERLVQYGYGSDRMVKGRLVDVIHGRLSPDGDQASLIISTFQFLGSTTSRRFQHAKITWNFAYADSDEHECPEVKKISPDGHYVMNQTTFDESTVKNVGASLQGGVEMAGLGLSAGWSRTQSATIADHISLYGTDRATRQNWGEPDGAEWVLQENSSQRSGIPSSLTTAILVKRKPDRAFIGMIKIKANMDLGSIAEVLFGKKPKVDPVVFDLALAPRSANYDQQNLDSIALDDIGIAKLNILMPSTNP